MKSALESAIDIYTEVRPCAKSDFMARRITAIIAWRLLEATGNLHWEDVCEAVGNIKENSNG